MVSQENPVAADIEELINLDEDIVVYEDNENWENEVLFPADVEEVEDDDDELEAPPPSLREIQGIWTHLKSFILRRGSEKLLSGVTDFDHLLRQEIEDNRPTMTQTPLTSYFC